MGHWPEAMAVINARVVRSAMQERAARLTVCVCVLALARFLSSLQSGLIGNTQFSVVLASRIKLKTHLLFSSN